jgi:hypothetical protein
VTSPVNDDDGVTVVVTAIVSPRTRHRPLPTPVSTRRHPHTQTTSGLRITASDVNDDGDGDDAVTRAVAPRTSW